MSLQQDIDWYKEGERDVDFVQHLAGELLARIAKLEAALAERDEALRSACRKWAMCCDPLVVCKPCIRNAGQGYRQVTREARAEEGSGT